MSNVMATNAQLKEKDQNKESANSLNKGGSVYNSDTAFTSISLREETKDADKICRICYGGDSTFDKLMTPCLCSGSTKYAHETCLLQWVTFKGSKTCELCLYNMEIHCKGIKPFWKVWLKTM